MADEILTQRVLDVQGCDTPDCGHDHTVLVLTQRCHPKAGLEVAYSKATGLLACTCKRCGSEVGVIAVAWEREGGHV